MRLNANVFRKIPSSGRSPIRASVRLDLDRIRSSALRIAPVFRNTPQYVWPPLGCELILKLETANPIRCFKGRGNDLVHGPEIVDHLFAVYLRLVVLEKLLKACPLDRGAVSLHYGTDQRVSDSQ